MTDLRPQESPVSQAGVAPQAQVLQVGNAQAVPLDRVPTVTMDAFRRLAIGGTNQQKRIVSLFGVPESEPSSGTRLRLYLILADDARSKIEVTSTCLTGDDYPSITQKCPQAHLFEREIAELHGVVPTGHPWLKPVRFLRPRDSAPEASRGAATENAASGRPNAASTEPSTIGVMDYYHVEGDEVHEVAVGPVHAGVIEPGHFRFNCHGEQVLHLEISLGYQHRGIERALTCGPNLRSIHYLETAAGDTTVGHTLAYCQAMEALGGGRASARANCIRAIALELERMANHVGDLGALAGDVGFLPTAAYAGRLRGDLLNLTAAVCGNRFGRVWLRPGGVKWDLEPELATRIRRDLEATAKDIKNAVELLWESSSVQARFEGTGTLSSGQAEALGLVGVAARASGLERDVRHDHPTGIYRLAQIPMSVLPSGDVFARAYVRWLEIQRSTQFIQEQLQSLPRGDCLRPVAKPKPEQLVVSLVEGFRGEVCHVAVTDRAGYFRTYKVCDASFHNWQGLALALRNQQISDFPLCNKSFNLSYSGHDL